MSDDCSSFLALGTAFAKMFPNCHNNRAPGDAKGSQREIHVRPKSRQGCQKESQRDPSGSYVCRIFRIFLSYLLTLLLDRFFDCVGIVVEAFLHHHGMSFWLISVH